MHRCHYCNITNYELSPQMVEQNRVGLLDCNRVRITCNRRWTRSFRKVAAREQTRLTTWRSTVGLFTVEMSHSFSVYSEFNFICAHKNSTQVSAISFPRLTNKCTTSLCADAIRGILPLRPSGGRQIAGWPALLYVKLSGTACRPPVHNTAVCLCPCITEIRDLVAAGHSAMNVVAALCITPQFCSCWLTLLMHLITWRCSSRRS
jgi:hypothetical protein